MLMLFLFGLCTPMILWIAFEIFICTQEKVIKKVLQKTVGGKNRVVDKVLGVSSPKTSKLKAFGKNIHAKTSKIEKGVEDLARRSKDALKGTIHFIKGVVRVSIFITTNFALFGVLINIMLSFLLVTAVTNTTLISATNQDGFTLKGTATSTATTSTTSTTTTTAGTYNLKLLQVAEKYASVSRNDSSRFHYNQNRSLKNKEVDCSSFVSGCFIEGTGLNWNLSKVAKTNILDGGGNNWYTGSMIDAFKKHDAVVLDNKGSKISVKTMNEKAKPGDVIMHSGHAAIYVEAYGDGYIAIEAAGKDSTSCSDSIENLKKGTKGLTFGYSYVNYDRFTYIFRPDNLKK